MLRVGGGVAVGPGRELDADRHTYRAAWTAERNAERPSSPVPADVLPRPGMDADPPGLRTA